MNPPEGDKEDDIWLKRYINSDQNDQRLVNTFINEDFDLT